MKFSESIMGVVNTVAGDLEKAINEEETTGTVSVTSLFNLQKGSRLLDEAVTAIQERYDSNPQVRLNCTVKQVIDLIREIFVVKEAVDEAFEQSAASTLHLEELIKLMDTRSEL